MREERAVFMVGTLHAVLFVLYALGVLIDDVTVMGVNRWIKPMKFGISIAIYLWTAAWLMRQMRFGARARRILRIVLPGTMLVETVAITLQAMRGTASHFNIATPFDIAVFNLMGVAIMLNAIGNVYLLVRFVRTAPRPWDGLAWGIALGLAIFVIAGLEGGYMIGNQAHSSGGPDGGPGLPFVNWSTTHGDLRVAHFLGLHALQALPLAGWLLERVARRRAFRFAQPAQVTVLLAVLYAIVVFGTFALALAGRPLLRF